MPDNESLRQIITGRPLWTENQPIRRRVRTQDNVTLEKQGHGPTPQARLYSSLCRNLRRIVIIPLLLTSALRSVQTKTKTQFRNASDDYVISVIT
jgi:hypothetical protein